jgi:hypothetical protein
MAENETEAEFLPQWYRFEMYVELEEPPEPSDAFIWELAGKFKELLGAAEMSVASPVLEPCVSSVGFPILKLADTSNRPVVERLAGDFTPLEDLIDDTSTNETS